MCFVFVCFFKLISFMHSYSDLLQLNPLAFLACLVLVFLPTSSLLFSIFCWHNFARCLTDSVSYSMSPFMFWWILNFSRRRRGGGRRAAWNCLIAWKEIPPVEIRHSLLSAKHQNCHFWEIKEELKRTEKNFKELKLSKWSGPRHIKRTKKNQ